MHSGRSQHAVAGDAVPPDPLQQKPFGPLVLTRLTAGPGIQGAQEVPVHAATGVGGGLLSLFMRVELERVGRVWLLLDSANLGGVIVSVRWPLTGDSATLRIAPTGLRAAVTPARVIHDGTLSEAVIRALTVTLDLHEMRASVTPNAPGFDTADG